MSSAGALDRWCAEPHRPDTHASVDHDGVPISAFERFKKSLQATRGVDPKNPARVEAKPMDEPTGAPRAATFSEPTISRPRLESRRQIPALTGLRFCAA